MTREEYDLIVRDVKRLDQDLGSLIKRLGAVDREGLPSVNDDVAASADQSVSQDDDAAPAPPPKKKKKTYTVIKDPKLRELVKDQEEKKEKRESVARESTGKRLREAPYPVIINDIVAPGKIDVYDPITKENATLDIDQEVFNDIDTNELGKLQIDLTEEELNSIGNNWVNENPILEEETVNE